MVDTKKEQERDELHRAIWAIADELRGAVDGWDFKNYVLGTMFYRYISENLTNYINAGEQEAGNDETLNETLERVFNHIESSAKGSSSESSFAGLFDDFDVNSNKLGSTVAKRNERLAKLLHGVADMNLGDVKDHDIDAFGDAYEYLMTMYASGAGKSGGEFFTPADVSDFIPLAISGKRDYSLKRKKKAHPRAIGHRDNLKSYNLADHLQAVQAKRASQ